MCKSEPTSVCSRKSNTSKEKAAVKEIPWCLHFTVKTFSSLYGVCFVLALYTRSGRKWEERWSNVLWWSSVNALISYFIQALTNNLKLQFWIIRITIRWKYHHFSIEKVSQPFSLLVKNTQGGSIWLSICPTSNKLRQLEPSWNLWGINMKMMQKLQKLQKSL